MCWDRPGYLGPCWASANPDLLRRATSLSLRPVAPLPLSQMAVAVLDDSRRKVQWLDRFRVILSPAKNSLAAAVPGNSLAPLNSCSPSRIAAIDLCSPTVARTLLLHRSLCWANVRVILRRRRGGVMNRRSFVAGLGSLAMAPAAQEARLHTGRMNITEVRLVRLKVVPAL